MNKEQLNRIQNDQGFIAALDQSGGSTPSALASYGIDQDSYQNEAEMFHLMHQMRTRVITSPAFSNQYILAAILFKQTMRGQIDGIDTADYLWQRKNVVPFLKIDEGLAELINGVQLMKPISELDSLLNEAKDKHIFGTKMRSVIKEFNEEGLRNILDQQFSLAEQIYSTGLIPIIEPEVDINANNKSQIENVLLDSLLSHLDNLGNQKIMLKLTIPDQDNLYGPLIKHPNVIRVVALSGGYNRNQANEKLARNQGLIASFSRALLEDLSANQPDQEFNETLEKSIQSIYRASVT